jgi:phosphoribosylglycinamide formyltransferase 1
LKPAVSRNVVVLISGRGSNLQALLDSERDGRISARVAAVISDQSGAAGLQRARAAGVPTCVVAPGDHGSRREHEQALADVIDRYTPAAVVLAGFMRVLGEPFVDRFTGRLINIHPSLLPHHPGLHTHQRVLEAGDREHGATVHFVDAGLDAGPRIIQYRIAVRADDTPQSLAARVLAGEHRILVQAVDWLACGRLSLVNGRVMLDGRILEEPVLAEG